MSIVPVSDQGADIDIWDPEIFFGSSLDHLMMEHPSSSLFHGFLFPFPSIFFPSHETQVIRWQQTPRAHVVRGVFPAAAGGGGGGGGGSSPSENVLVYIDDDNMLQISTEDGKFMSSFKLPDDARRDQVKASMVNGVLTVVIPKEAAAAAAAGHRPNVRPIQITGSD